jgi:hypothetical protein
VLDQRLLEELSLRPELSSSERSSFDELRRRYPEMAEAKKEEWSRRREINKLVQRGMSLLEASMALYRKGAFGFGTG